MTAQDSSEAAERKRRRFQFSLRGLMVFVFGAAVGLSVAEMKGRDWIDGVLGAVAAWIVLGLIHQARDLWRAAGGQGDLTSHQRWALRFAAFWRLGVTGILIGYYAVCGLLELELIDLPELEDSFYSAGSDLRAALVCLCAVIVVSSVMPSRPAQRRLRSDLLNLAALAAGVALCVCICWVGTTIHFLVATAVQSIEMAQPLHLALEGVEILPAARTERFFHECSLATGLALLCLFLTYGLAVQWPHRGWWRVVWAGLLAAALPISVSYVIWLLAAALPRAFPIMIEAQCLGPVHVWITILLVLLVLVTAGTYRLVGFSVEPSARAQLSLPSTEMRYYHERRTVILVLAAAMGAQVVLILWYYFGVNWGPFLDWWDIVLPLFCSGDFLMRWAVLLAAICTVWRVMRAKRVSDTQGPPGFSPAHFAVVWLALFLSVGALVPAMILFGFSLWFSPWFLGVWP